MNVFGYLRVSGRGQVDGDGPERQRQAIKSFCEAHRLTFIREYFEGAISGTVEGIDRPQFFRMLEEIELAKICGSSAIIVERMDRLARDLMVQEFIIAECHKRGIKVFSADQGALIDMVEDSGDPTRKLIRQILGALAEWEKSQLVLKLRVARQRVKAKTGRCEGRKFYGETAVERRILKLALDTFSAVPDYGVTARLLNEGGFKTRYGKKWTRQNTRGLITSHIKHSQAL